VIFVPPLSASRKPIGAPGVGLGSPSKAARPAPPEPVPLDPAPPRPAGAVGASEAIALAVDDPRTSPAAS